MEHHQPPVGPPPLLTAEEISLLCRQGWLLYDLPSHLKAQIDQLNRTASAFFRQDCDQKIACLAGKNLEEEGYFDVPDEKQYVTFRRCTAAESPLEQQAKDVWAATTRFLHRILCDLSRAGSLPAAAWDSMLAGMLDYPYAKADLRDITSLLRLFEYLPKTGAAAQHTDLGLLTLCVGTDAGLEVLDKWQQPHAWIDGSKCTVLVGETLRALAHGNIAAGVHRVVGNPAGRQSFVFALRPNLGATADLSHFGGEGSIGLRQLFMKIKGSKYNVNARPEVREQQRQRQREQREQHIETPTIT